MKSNTQFVFSFFHFSGVTATRLYHMRTGKNLPIIFPTSLGFITLSLLADTIVICKQFGLKSDQDRRNDGPDLEPNRLTL